MLTPDETADRELLPCEVRGSGRDIVLIPAFGFTPWAYKDTIKVLARHSRMIVPDWLHLGYRFNPERAVRSLLATLDHHRVDDAVLVSHSYGGTLGVRMASADLDRWRRVIFIGSAALQDRWELARYAVPGPYMWRMATFRAAVGAMRGAGRHPLATIRAGWYGFMDDPATAVRALANSDVPRHVLWAERDTLLPRHHGQDFARQIGATFDLVVDPYGPGEVDHDWVWRHPHLLEDQLERLDELPPRQPGRTARRLS